MEAETYLFKSNLRFAQKFDKEVVDFLVENGYAVFDRRLVFGDGFPAADYYRPINRDRSY